MAMFNSTISSSLPGGASPYISDYFNVSDPSAKLLPSTVYLVGYIVGPLLLSPMSEEIGRRPILLLASALFFVSSIACALSPNFATLVVFRFFAGAGGSAPISIIGGVLADIYEDPAVRGTATAAYTVVTCSSRSPTPEVAKLLANCPLILSCFSLQPSEPFSVPPSVVASASMGGAGPSGLRRSSLDSFWWDYGSFRKPMPHIYSGKRPPMRGLWV